VKQRSDLAFLASIVLLAGALIWVVSGTLEQRIIQVGDTAPDFSVTTDHGKTITRDHFGGKLLVLNFWATWCPPCIEETPSLNAFARTYAADGVVVLGVSTDRNEKLYRQFVQTYKLGFETARDPESNIPASYGTFQLPETYIIDKSGKVIEKVISNQNWMDPDFVARIKKML
jgi:cytochrome c biogenesis protein CcmG/thiol:disulfide interchange protein DsbE